MEIVQALRNIQNDMCSEIAKQITSNPLSCTKLHLRNQQLSQRNIISIAKGIKNSRHKLPNLRSMSFSYNDLMGDKGALSLAKSFPSSILEIGMVHCNISDIGCKAILQSIKNLPHLKMICIEENNFSSAMKIEFSNYCQGRSNLSYYI